jgi:hypothetical protein
MGDSGLRILAAQMPHLSSKRLGLRSHELEKSTQPALAYQVFHGEIMLTHSNTATPYFGYLGQQA